MSSAALKQTIRAAVEGQCFFNGDRDSVREVWQRQFLVEPGNPTSGSWLSISADGKHAYCSTCRRYVAESPLVHPPNKVQGYVVGSILCRSLKTANLQRHADCGFHTTATSKLLGLVDPQASLYGAPPLELFESIYDKVVISSASPDSCGGWKTRHICACLSEAIKVADQDFIKKCESMTLLRDARKNRLDVRFVGVDDMFNVRHGFVGRVRMKTADGRSIAEQTMEVVNRFCSSILVGGERTPVNKRLRGQFRKAVMLLCTDAAADELLASEMLRGGRAISAALPADVAFPNIKAVLRDKAHSSVRVIRRPFKASDTIEQLMHDFVRGKNSPAQMVQNSHTLQALWQQCLQEQNGVKTFANLSAAKHRFNSYSEPLGRLCLQIVAMHTFMTRVAAVPGSGVQQLRAREWLRKLDSRSLLLLAMCGDASDECARLCHFCDSEDMDVAMLGGILEDFKKRMTSLFGPQRSCLGSGYTSSITQCLKHNKLVWIDGKVVRHISEPSASDHDWAFSEMASFLRLALAELSVEFPSFEVTQAFRVFDVSSGNKHWSIDNPDVQADLARLAKVFQVDYSNFAKEFERVRGRVVVEVKTSQSNSVAWATVCRHLQSGRSRQSLDGLFTVTRGFLAWVASTSGVEQGFSKCSRAFTVHQETCSEIYEEQFALLHIEGRNHHKTQLSRVAQRLWLQNGYGNSRQTENRVKRSDAGCRKTQPQDLEEAHESHAAFRKRRRVDVAAAAAAVTQDQVNAACVFMDAAWTPKHAKEEMHVQAKLENRRAQASREGALLPSEDSTYLRKSGSQQLIKMAEGQRKREQLRGGRLQRSIGGPGLLSVDDLWDKAFFLHAGVRKLAGLQDYLIRAGCGMTLSSCMMSADFLVCSHELACDPKPSCTECWVSCLLGTPLATPGFFGFGAGPKLMFAHKAGLHKRRGVHITNSHAVSQRICVSQCDLPMMLLHWRGGYAVSGATCFDIWCDQGLCAVCA